MREIKLFDTLPEPHIFTGYQPIAVKHPAGGAVWVRMNKENQYTTYISVDLYNIPFKVVSSHDGFWEEFGEYLELQKKNKEIGAKRINAQFGGTYNSAVVLNKDAEKWLRKLWDLCTNPENLVQIETDFSQKFFQK